MTSLEDMYGIIIYVSGELLYVHYTLKEAYFFKRGILGACTFTYANASVFIQKMFGPNSRVSTMRLNPSSNFEIKPVTTTQNSGKKRDIKQPRKKREPKNEESPLL